MWEAGGRKRAQDWLTEKQTITSTYFVLEVKLFVFLFLCCMWLAKEDFLKNLHVLSCFVQLKSVLLNSCVFWIFFQNAGSQLFFRFFCRHPEKKYISTGRHTNATEILLLFQRGMQSLAVIIPLWQRPKGQKGESLTTTRDHLTVRRPPISPKMEKRTMRAPSTKLT